MGIFKKRTTKTVGRDIGRSIARQSEKEKIIRTLEKEKLERGKERELNLRIKRLKEERPTAIKKLISGAKATIKVTSATGRLISKSISKPKKRSKKVKRIRSAKTGGFLGGGSPRPIAGFEMFS